MLEINLKKINFFSSNKSPLSSILYSTAIFFPLNVVLCFLLFKKALQMENVIRNLCSHIQSNSHIDLKIENCRIERGLLEH